MIRGNVVALRAPAPEDQAVLLEIRNDVALQRSLMARPQPNDMERLAAWIERRTTDPTGVFFVIATSDDGRAVGFVQATAMDTVSGVAELGLCIAAGQHRRGYGREALQLLEPYLADVFGVRKLVLRVLAENEPAIGLYLSIGFREVGVHEAHFRFGDELLDVTVMEHVFQP